MLRIMFFINSKDTSDRGRAKPKTVCFSGSVGLGVPVSNQLGASGREQSARHNERVRLPLGRPHSTVASLIRGDSLGVLVLNILSAVTARCQSLLGFGGI